MLSVASARLPTGDAPVCGVPLIPYVLIHRGDAPGAVAGDEVPEEGSAAAGDTRFSLRFRWYRSIMHRGSALCWIHPDREAKLQVRALVWASGCEDSRISQPELPEREGRACKRARARPPPSARASLISGRPHAPRPSPSSCHPHGEASQ